MKIGRHNINLSALFLFNCNHYEEHANRDICWYQQRGVIKVYARTLLITTDNPASLELLNIVRLVKF
jgi:hypothetical protein